MKADFRRRGVAITRVEAGPRKGLGAADVDRGAQADIGLNGLGCLSRCHSRKRCDAGSQPDDNCGCRAFHDAPPSVGPDGLPMNPAVHRRVHLQHFLGSARALVRPRPQRRPAKNHCIMNASGAPRPDLPASEPPSGGRWLGRRRRLAPIGGGLSSRSGSRKPSGSESRS